MNKEKKLVNLTVLDLNGVMTLVRASGGIMLMAGAEEVLW